MKNDMTTRFKMAVIIGVAFVSNAIPAGNSFEVITDIDLGFFLTNPKLPWGDDPFLKEPGFALVAPSNEKFILGGIAYTKSNPMAVVNGKTVHTGDQVGDRKIAEIGDNYVILKKHNSEIEINLPPLRDDDEDADSDEDEE